MKKKSVRKISSSKKIVSKSPLKKRKFFSLKSWLLGGLVLLVASVYGLYQYNLQPKGIKVLEIPGSILDYLEPEAVSINLVKSCAQDPECADLVDATRRAGKPITFQEQSQNVTRVVEKVQKDFEKVEVKDDGDLTAQEEAVKEVKDVAATLKSRTEATMVLEAQKKSAQNKVVGGGAGCRTQYFNVGDGETMVGTVASDAQGNVIGDSVVQCVNGSWQTYAPGGKPCYEGDEKTRPECKITVKPIYAGGKNCYNDGGASVLGDGSISENGDGTASRCDGGTMKTDLQKVGDRWLTPDQVAQEEAAKKAKEDARKAQLEYNKVNCKGTWDDKAEVCRSSKDSCASIGKDFDGKNCVDKKTTNNNSAVYNDRDDCEDAIVDSTKETCRQSPNGSTFIRIPLTPGTSTATQYVGGVYESKDNCEKNLPSGQSCRQSPNGTSWTRFTISSANNTPNTQVYEGGNYGSESECERANPGKSCRQSPNGSTWTVFTLTQTNFGNTNQPSNFTPSPDVSRQGYLTPEKCKQEYGVDCLQIGAGSWYPPTTQGDSPGTLVASTPETPFSNSFSNFETWSACVNDAGKTQDEACIKTPDGKYSQVPDDNPNVSCNFWGCQWKVDTTESGNTPATNGNNLINPSDQQRTANQVVIGSLGCVAVAGAFAISTGGLGLPALGLCASGALAGTIIGSLIP